MLLEVCYYWLSREKEKNKKIWLSQSNKHQKDYDVNEVAFNLCTYK